MKLKIIPVLVIVSFFLVSCSLFSNLKSEQPLTDAEMATRVADLLSTMTTPTSEIDFPATPTMGLPTTAPTVTPNIIMLPTSTPVVAVGGDQPTSTAMIVLPTLAATPTPEVTQAATQQTSPTATLNVPSTDPINKLGTPTGDDPMDVYSKWAWPTGADDYIDVQFKDGFLLMTNLSKVAAGWRLPLLDQQTDTYIELTANSGTCTGKDSYGIIFRVPVLKSPDQGYLYQVTCDGYYRLWKWDGKVGDKGLALSLLNWKQSAKINKGPNQTNRLGVMVKDKTITLYMNGVQLGSVVDSSFSAGFFGAFVRSGGDTNYTAKLDEMKYWENPK
jgi:hypothetical protein